MVLNEGDVVDGGCDVEGIPNQRRIVVATKQVRVRKRTAPLDVVGRKACVPEGSSTAKGKEIAASAEWLASDDGTG